MPRRARQEAAVEEANDFGDVGVSPLPEERGPGEDAITFPQQPDQSASSSPDQQSGQFVSKIPDPHGRHGINIGDGRGMRLFLNRRFRQNAIMFTAPEGENPKPDKEDTDWLREHGWTWRNEEKVWTKQLARDSEEAPWARANSDKQAEDEFVDLANRIRERKGMAPVDYAFGRER